MTNNRTKPDWGEAIFSEHCVIMRPDGEDSLSDFVKYAIAVTRMHLQLARLQTPVQTNRCAARRVSRKPDIFFCGLFRLLHKSSRCLNPTRHPSSLLSFSLNPVGAAPGQ